MDRKFGCLKEKEDKRDYRAKVVSAPKFPTQFSLSMPSVKDQGVVGSCVAHSLATFLERYFAMNFSVGFIYGYRPDNYSHSSGMYPREALKTIQKIGDVQQGVFNYNIEVPEIIKLVNERLDELKSLAKDYKIESYARIYTENEIKSCLYSGTPVPASIPVYNNLELNEKYQVKQEGTLDGYHMILIYGWNEDGFMFQNSWGKSWGDSGRAIISYNYEIDSAWAISMKNNNINTYQTFWQRVYKLILRIRSLFIKK